MILELYLSSIIFYSLIALIFGFAIGWSTLTQTEKTLDIFGGFKKFNLTTLFEKIFTIFTKMLKAITGINIDPEIKK